MIWLALVTSGEFGFEREVIEKATLDHIPLPAFDKLAASRRREVAMLIDGLQSGEVTWDEVDAWVNDLYGLGKRDLQIILDTLEFSLPFAENKRNAQALPSSAERERFRAVLRDELLPWCDRFGSTLAVEEIPPLAMSPWQALSVRAVRREPTGTVPAREWVGLLGAADEAAASEILVDNGSDGPSDCAACAEALLERDPGAAPCTADSVVPRWGAERSCHRMTGSATRPRYDQVAELTRGLRLPLAAIAHVHLEILAERLQRAFDDVRVDYPHKVATGEEPEVTTLMQARLNRMIHEDPLWGQLVLSVGRGAESISFDGSRLETVQTSRSFCQPPTGGFRWSRKRRFSTLRRRRRQGGIVRTGFAASWKASTRGATAKAFMIGYVRDGSSIATTLKDYLSKAMELNPDRYRGSAPCSCRVRLFRLGLYAAWPGLRVWQPATAKRPRSDFGLAFVADVGGGAQALVGAAYHSPQSTHAETALMGSDSSPRSTIPRRNAGRSVSSRSDE